MTATVRPGRVPFDPLEELVRYRVVADDLTGEACGVPRIARTLQVDRQQIHRWRRYGVTADQAVTLADRIRVHWANVWPELLDARSSS